MNEWLNSRYISKEIDKEGRRDLARQIRKMRAEVIREISETKKGIQNTISELEQLNERLNNLNTSNWFSQVFRVKEKNGLVQQIQTIETNLRQLTDKLHTLRQQLHDQNRFIKEHIVDSYYKKMENQHLSVEEKERYLKPEILATLSMEEYLKMWRRLNPYWLANVTRHGVRDHASMLFHTSGLGEYSSGAMDLFQSGQLMTPIRVHLNISGNPQTDKESIKQLLGQHILADPSKGGARSAEEAKRRFLDLVQKNPYNTAYPYADMTALHFSAMDILNDYYGAEKNNDIFFIIPSDVVASQFYFYFNTGDAYASFSKPVPDRKWNDVFVWPKSGKLKDASIPVDAMLVFIPEDVQVDKETGSKYVIDENGKRIEDEEIKTKFQLWLKERKSDEYLKNMIISYNETRKSGRDPKLIEDQIKTHFHDSLLKSGIDEERASDIVRVIFELGEFYTELPKTGHIVKSTKRSGQIIDPAERILRLSNAIWKRPRDSISSKEYWTALFDSKPNIKPKHIIYYNGDPKEAVFDFLKQNKIEASVKYDQDEGDRFLGFDKNRVTNLKEDDRANPDLAYLINIANKVIDEHFV